MSKKTLRGNQLQPRDRAHVLDAYIYRGTVENQRQHPDAVRRAGARLPLITDEQWLSVTKFWVKRDGQLDHRVKHCLTNHHEIPAHAEILRIPA